MQHNKYIEDLGIPLKNIGTNFCDDTDERNKKWKEERKIYGFDERETWSLDHYFVEWLYSHLMMYMETGGTVIDLNYHKFNFAGKEYTQKEAIDYILYACKEYLLCDDIYCGNTGELIPNTQKAIRLFAEILPAMWW